MDGRKYEGMATVGVDETRIRPTTVNPEDFDAFWTGAIAEARKQPLDPKMTLLPVDALHAECSSCQLPRMNAPALGRTENLAISGGPPGSRSAYVS